MENIDKDMRLDLKDPFSLFCIFLVVLCIAAWVIQKFPFDTEIFGDNLTKHLSDIMTEHEAGKSMFAISLYVLFMSYVKFFISLRWKCNTFFDKYFVLAPAGFLISLIFVEMAVTVSVVVMVPKEPYSPWPELFYLGGKNLALSICLVGSMMVLNNASLVPRKFVKFFVSLFLSSMYFWALGW